MAPWRDVDLCAPHTSGVCVGSPPFFYPNCKKCQEKPAKGLVKGDEGPLAKNWYRKKYERPGFTRGPKVIKPFPR